MELYAAVRLAVVDEGLSHHEAGRRFGIDRRTVKKMLSYSAPPGYRRTKPVRRPKLDGFTGIVDAILEADTDPDVPRKQRHTAHRIFERLRDEHGFTGGYTIVKDYVRARRQSTREAFVPLHHPPGHAQVDFGEAVVEVGGTGCRKGEIVHLCWSEVHRDALVLADSKTGARKVPLNTQARRILERQPRGGSPFVFPSPLDPSRPRSYALSLWLRVRRQADIEDVRLHDLRHTHASHAVMNGVPVPVVSRLLGHSSVRMTLRYAHLGDREIEAAAERIGEAIGAIMGL